MYEEAGQSGSDWTEADLSGISEADFPIHCDDCGHRLTGLSDHGRCPECFLAFTRRQRLWAIYGPEAFAKPAIVKGEGGTAPGDRRFVVALFTALLCVTSIPVTVLIWRAVFGTVDLVLCLIVWLLIVSCVEWILAARGRAGEERHDEDGNDDH